MKGRCAPTIRHGATTVDLVILLERNWKVGKSTFSFGQVENSENSEISEISDIFFQDF